MITTRALSLFPSYVDPMTLAPALRAVAVYAAQNPGFEFGNYYSGFGSVKDYKAGVAGYRSDSRRATSQLHACRVAMRGALRATDDDVIEACRRAFSGRLTVTRRDDGSIDIDYCTGQCFPTEFRAACAAVLEAAGRLAHERTMAQVESRLEA